MDKTAAGLLGAVVGLATMGAAQAAPLHAETYADLLAPVTNAVAVLRADDAARASVQDVQYYGQGYYGQRDNYNRGYQGRENYGYQGYNNHHHHHHQQTYYHHHHDHHQQPFNGILGGLFNNGR